MRWIAVLQTVGEYVVGNTSRIGIVIDISQNLMRFYCTKVCDNVVDQFNEALGAQFADDGRLTNVRWWRIGPTDLAKWAGMSTTPIGCVTLTCTARSDSERSVSAAGKIFGTHQDSMLIGIPLTPQDELQMLRVSPLCFHIGSVLNPLLDESILITGWMICSSCCR